MIFAIAVIILLFIEFERASYIYPYSRSTECFVISVVIIKKCIVVYMDDLLKIVTVFLIVMQLFHLSYVLLWYVHLDLIVNWISYRIHRTYELK